MLDQPARMLDDHLGGLDVGTSKALMYDGGVELRLPMQSATVVTPFVQGGADRAWGDLYGAVDIWCPLFSLHRQDSAAQRQGQNLVAQAALKPDGTDQPPTARTKPKGAFE